MFCVGIDRGDVVQLLQPSRHAETVTSVPTAVAVLVAWGVLRSGIHVQ
jgi:hypothetical protein